MRHGFPTPSRRSLPAGCFSVVCDTASPLAEKENSQPMCEFAPLRLSRQEVVDRTRVVDHTTVEGEMAPVKAQQPQQIDPRVIDDLAEMLAYDEKLEKYCDYGFGSFDKDGDGLLSFAELGEWLCFVTADLSLGGVVARKLGVYLQRLRNESIRRLEPELCFSKTEGRVLCRDMMLLTYGEATSIEAQTEVHLKRLFNSIDADGDGMLIRQELADSAVVQREFRFLVDVLRNTGADDVPMPFSFFQELVLREASGLIKVRMLCERFDAVARLKGKTLSADSELTLSKSEIRELLQEQLHFSDAAHLRGALAAVDGAKGGSITCSELIAHAVDVMDYLQHQLAQIVGLGGLKKKLLAFCRGAILDKKRLELASREGHHFQPGKPRHMIFRGNPGSGKTTIARIVADVLFKLGLLRKNRCVTVQREDLVADVVGGTAKLTKKRVKDAAGGVLFIDEAYRLFPKDADPKDFGREAVDELMAAMLEEGAPVMIFAGYPKLMDGFLLANPGLRSRIPTTLEFDDYSWAELATIMDQVVTKNGFRLMKKVKLTQVMSILRHSTPPGAADAMNGRMCELVFEGAKQVLDARMCDWQDGDDAAPLFELSADDVREGCRNVPRPADLHLTHLQDSEAGEESEDDSADARTWLCRQLDELVGMDDFKEQLRRFQQGIELDRRRAEQGRAVQSNKNFHMIFTGNPGTGKKTVARLMSALLQRVGVLETRKLVEAQREAFIGQGAVGSAEAATIEIVESARGGVLFVDQADRLHDGHVGQAVLETLMQRMLRPDAPVMIFAGYPEEMAKFEMANKGLASRIPYRFEFADFSAAALAKIFRLKVGRSGLDLAGDTSDLELEVVPQEMNLEAAFEEAVSRSACAKTNGRLCDTALTLAKEELDRECTREGELSSTVTIEHVRKGLQRATGSGAGVRASGQDVSVAHRTPAEAAGTTDEVDAPEAEDPTCKESERARP